VRRGAVPPHEISALGSLLHEMRLLKSRAELKLMREAARISVRAHERAMAVTRPGLREYHIEAELLAEFRRGDAVAAYDCIVGSGDNARVRHYRAGAAELRVGDMLLIDAGGEYRNYAADISRSFPVNGRFTPAQRALYDIVLD